MVLETLPHLRGLLLAEAVYALYESQLATLKQLLPLFSKSQYKDELALGVFWSAGRRVHDLSVDAEHLVMGPLARRRGQRVRTPKGLMQMNLRKTLHYSSLTPLRFPQRFYLMLAGSRVLEKSIQHGT
jgi:hypothetical protein